MFTFAKAKLDDAFGNAKRPIGETDENPVKKIKTDTEPKAKAKGDKAQINNQPFSSKTTKIDNKKIETQLKVYKAQIKKRKKEIKVNKEIKKNSPPEELLRQAEPLRKEKYSEQLLKKNSYSINQLLCLKERLQKCDWKDGHDQVSWAFKKKPIPFEYFSPIHSPVINGYSSHCEFTMGDDTNGEPVVGIAISPNIVVEPSQCLHIPDFAKQIAKYMTHYIQVSELPVYSRFSKSGYWKQIVIKTQTTGDTMVVIQLYKDDLSDERIKEEKDSLLYYFSKLDTKLTTLLISVYNNDNKTSNTEVLSGKGFVYEKISGYKFRISPASFFYENTFAAEKLYKKCVEWCTDTKKRIILLDLCCGTGVLSTLASKSVDRVIGIDIQREAIKDAVINAKSNGIKNAAYYTDSVENKLDFISQDFGQDCVVVLDPPRNCVQAKVLRAIRSNKCINRVIFICSDPKQFLCGFYSITRPSTDKINGVHFTPKRAVVVDTSPHVYKQQLLIEFIRESST